MNAMRSYTDVRIVLGLLALLWCFAPSQASGEVQAVTNGGSGPWKARALAAAWTRPPAGPGEDLRAPAAQESTPRGARVRVHGVGATLATTVRPNRRPDDTE